MKKYLLIALAVILAAGISVGIAGLAGAFENSPESSVNSSSTSSSQASQSSSSAKEELDVVLIERDPVSDTVIANMKEATLKGLYLIAEGDTAVLSECTKGITIGDLALVTLGQLFDFGYYSDGNWYVGGEDGNLVKFSKVPNVLFNYELGCGKPLELNQQELSIYGHMNLVSLVEGQFNVKFTQLITSILPSGISNMMNKILQITVRDFYNITNGDYTYIEQTIKTTTADEMVDFAIDVLELSGERDYKELRKALIEMLDGTLENIVINDQTTVNTLIIAYFASYDADNFTATIAQSELIKLYKGVSIADFESATKAFEIDDVIEVVAEIALADADKEASEEIELWAEYLTDLLDGTVGEIVINQEADLTAIIQTLLENSDATEVEQTAQILATFIKETINLFENLKDKTEITSAEIEQYIVNATGCDIQDPQIQTFVLDLSTAIADVCNGSTEQLDEFATKYQSLTLQQIDGYLNGTVSEVLNSFGYDITEDLQSITVGDIKLAIDKLLENSNINIEQALENIQNSSDKIQTAIEEFENILNNLSEENKALTLGELFGESVTLDPSIATITVGDIVEWFYGGNGDHSLKLSTLDDLLLRGEIFKLFSENEIEELLNLTVADCISIIRIEASENSLEILDEVSLYETFKFIEFLSEQQTEVQ